ncbi:MAG: hypothetical protein GY694_21220 [Gammaproteobacteria bacterium]|nr:hypothetical protein [Gammaproteobacteria bacterium]
MQSSIKPILLILLINLSGCVIKHDYNWAEYPITAERISSQNSLTEDKEINVIKGTSDNSVILVGRIGLHAYYGSEQSLTDGMADQLTKELQKKRLIINKISKKSLEVTVNHSKFELGTWSNAAQLDFTVKFGNGKTKSYSVRNSSPTTVDRLFNGAVALAVIEIINDPEVITYVNQ